MPVGNPQFTDYQVNADDNQAASPIGAPEGNYQGRWVNDTARHMMAVIRRLGDASLLLSGSIYSAASKRIGNLAAGTTVTDAAQVDQTRGRTWWGGVAGGTANALTVTLSPAPTAFQAGDRLVFRVSSNTSSSTVTISPNGLGPYTIKGIDGGTLKANAFRNGRIAELVWDNDGFPRAISGDAAYMHQTVYDLLHPINSKVELYLDDTNPNANLPDGVTATWTLISKTFTRASALAIRDAAIAGANEGADNVALPDHVHSDGTLIASGTASQTIDVPSTPNEVEVPTPTANWNVEGNTGDPTTNPNIAMNPRVVIVRAWLRTA